MKMNKALLAAGLVLVASVSAFAADEAKPKVKATADQNLSTIGLDGILYFLGLKDSQIDP